MEATEHRILVLTALRHLLVAIHLLHLNHNGNMNSSSTTSSRLKLKLLHRLFRCLRKTTILIMRLKCINRSQLYMVNRSNRIRSRSHNSHLLTSSSLTF